LATMTAQRVTSLYDVMDAGYDATEIREHSRELGHVPIIPYKKRREKKIAPEADPQYQAKELSWAEQDRFRERTSVERVYARLKDEFGGRDIRVRGASKVMAHLIFGVLVLTADQIMKLAT
jgi:IS5 family transposase